MVTSQRKEGTGIHIVALAELDVKNMRVRIVLTRKAISERLREIEHPAEPDYLKLPSVQ
jgi:hypothetical protein